MSSVTLLCIATLSGFGQAPADAPAIRDITWRIGPNLPELRKGGCATTLDGKVISVFGMRQPWGEMDTMYVYDPATDWWMRGPNGPVGQCYVQGAECGDAFFAIGGRKGSVRTQCYWLTVGNDGYVWGEAPPLNNARGWAPSVSVGSELYVFGGAKGGHGPTMSSVEMFDTSDIAASWKIVSEIPGRSRGWLGAAAVKGAIYVFGGGHFYDPKPEDGPDRERLSDMRAFNPDTATWTERAPLPYRVAGMDSCVYGDRYIILVGGAAEADDFTPAMREAYEKSDRYESYYCPFVLVYDTQTDAWTVLPTLMPVPTNDIRVVLLGKRLYALGGENVEPATSNTTAWLRIGEVVTE
ncbi:MAG: hypothetical protein GY851_08730 [bacterium]|nr:hypothetical protein [bacterium]